MSSQKVIDITDRIPKKKDSKKNKNLKGVSAPLVDITHKRQEMIQKERRTQRRIMLDELVGVYIVLPEKGLQKVELYDISENGIAFDLNIDAGKFDKNEQIVMRIYLSRKTYIPFLIAVRNVRDITEDGVCRHGASITSQAENQESFRAFYKFIETASRTLQKDHGDLVINDR